MRTVSTIIQGAACQVTEPLNPTIDPPVYVIAHDDTITRQKNDGRAWFLAILCECQAQADHVAEQMKARPELGAPMCSYLPLVANEHSAPHVIPFRLLGRRWLEDWRETADRIEIREGGTGALYLAVIIDGQNIMEKRIPANRVDDEQAREIAGFRGLYPGLYQFDFRPA